MLYAQLSRSKFLRLLLPALCLSFLLSCASGPPPGEKPPPPGNDPASIGSWSEVLRWPVVAIHSHLLPNGKVLAWQRKDDVLTTETHLWDPETNTFTKVLNPFASVFCSGHTFLTDGTLLVAGGHHFHDGDGEKTLTLFDYRTNEWKKGQDMNAGRWYPTACALADGGTLVVAGSMASGQESAPNRLPQVWRAGGGWRDLTQAQQTLDLYPWMLLAPNGKVFMAGPAPRSQFLDTSGAGAWSDGPVNNFGYRDYGSAVMYEPGKVLVVGGGQNPPTGSAEIINLNSMFARWSYTGTMSFARRQLNATLLPDGKVLATGGTSASGFNNATGSVLAAEVWDPATGRWTTLASMSVRRLYHSTAVLLPDGRVLSAGGGMPASPQGGDANHLDAQIYSPPYLFLGPRPDLSFAPEKVEYGKAFTVSTPDAANIAQVTWVRLASVTHAFDQSQRFNRLRFSRDQRSLKVTAPSKREDCPPGPYLLFILNEKGVPSIGKVIWIS